MDEFGDGKSVGMGGIKNISWFSKDFDAKILWRLIHKKMLWSKVMLSK